jgi:hypothetical protein
MAIRILKPEHKYRARRTTVDNYNFDSQAEARYYKKLKMLMRAGEVVEIELQPKFEILESYKHPETGRKVQPVYYIADFRVTYKDGRVEVVDVKGVRTDLYRLKKKMFEKRYGIPIKEVRA